VQWLLTSENLTQELPDEDPTASSEHWQYKRPHHMWLILSVSKQAASMLSHFAYGVHKGTKAQTHQF
jgi:hypothetical protein